MRLVVVFQEHLSPLAYRMNMIVPASIVVTDSPALVTPNPLADRNAYMSISGLGFKYG
jgi:hypothetical protein